MNRFVYLLFIAVCWSCTHNSGTEKQQGKRDKIVNVDENIYNPHGNIYNPHEIIYDPHGKSYDPHRNIYDPHEKFYDPQEKFYDPHGKIYDPHAFGVVKFYVRVVNKSDREVNYYGIILNGSYF
ncbi:MAG: hypothetical protein LBT83_08665 [Tannerella sp.]|nr:hypothetical protein [Tannerella sp.]